MRFLHTRFIFPLVLSLALTIVGAAPVGAQVSGVLIGARRMAATGDSAASSRYETLWIVRSDDRPLRATLPDLLVPRPSGFERVGIVGTCHDSGDPWTLDRMWRVPAAVRPVVKAECPTVPASEVFGIAAGTDSAERAALDTVRVVCAVEAIEILFVTGDHIGARHTTGQTEDCEPRGDRNDVEHRVVRWGSDSTISFNSVAGPRADSAFARAARAALGTKEPECENLLRDVDARDWADRIDDWFVSRGGGRWRASVYGHTYGASCELEAPVALTLPNVLTGHDALRPSWASIARGVPGLIDAFASPSGDMVIAIVTDSLLAFEADGARLGRRLLAIPFRVERIVMAQWAVGAHAARWDREIARLRAGLQPARVIPDRR